MHVVAGEMPAFDLISANMGFWAWVDACDDPEPDLSNGSCVQPLSRARGNGKHQAQKFGGAVWHKKMYMSGTVPSVELPSRVLGFCG